MDYHLKNFTAPLVCHCCNGNQAKLHNSNKVATSYCRGCGTLAATHFINDVIAEPWNMASVTTTFKEALEFRRKQQAGYLIKKLNPVLKNKTILDYGCGQGAFVNFLLEQGHNCWGCDLELTNCDSKVPSDRFIAITEPWMTPSTSVDLVTLLDVLEHSPNPQSFLRELNDIGVKELLIKVPNFSGPVAIGARFLARFGKVALLEKLLLVEEISPHHSYFTIKGLRRLLNAAGYSVKKALSFPDVGPELPKRFRTADGTPVSGLIALGMTGVGAGLQLIAPIWSDTIAVYATKTQ